MPGVGKSDFTPPGQEDNQPPRFPVPVHERVASLKSALSGVSDFTEPEGDSFVIISGPNDVMQDGNVIGYEVRVKHFDSLGYEISIDEHRRFLYPPDGSYLNEYGAKIREVQAESIAKRMISKTVRQTPGGAS